jgi:hypothetical protein
MDPVVSMNKKAQMRVVGPYKIIKNTNEIRTLKGNGIFQSKLFLNSREYDLIENKIFIKHSKNNRIYIYHMYKYFNEHNVLYTGRWYDFFSEMPSRGRF